MQCVVCVSYLFHRQSGYWTGCLTCTCGRHGDLSSHAVISMKESNLFLMPRWLRSPYVHPVLIYGFIPCKQRFLPILWSFSWYYVLQTMTSKPSQFYIDKHYSEICRECFADWWTDAHLYFSEMFFISNHLTALLPINLISSKMLLQLFPLTTTYFSAFCPLPWDMRQCSGHATVYYIGRNPNPLNTHR